MSSPEEQILNAIAIAHDPYGYTQDPEIRAQAIDFLSNVRKQSAHSWRPALSLFLATNPEVPNEHQFGPDVRIFALSVLVEFLDIRSSKGPLAPDDFATLKEQLLNYLKSEYLYGSAESAAPFIRNKFSQVLTLLFLASYESQWPSFFSDMFTLLKPPPDTQIPPLNADIAIFFFKLVQEISAEVADQVLKNARAFSAERMARDGRVRDLVRERDAQEINAAVLAIVVDAKAKLDQTRAATGSSGTFGAASVSREFKVPEEVIIFGMRAFASYVSWIDINLTVTPDTIPLLFSLLSDEAPQIRLATTSALQRIVGKGLKVPSDKLKLVQVLSLGPVLDQLEVQTAAEVADATGYAENAVNFRDSLAHLANAFGLELVALCSGTTLSPNEIQAAAEMLEEFMPTALRFLADKYDDVSYGVLPLMVEILNSYKNAKKASPEAHMTTEKQAFLETMLGILINKLKWDEDDEPEDMDQDDVISFENMRKDVRKTMDTIYSLDNELVTGAISQRAQAALDAYEGGEELPWEEAELAIYLVFMYGELGSKDKGKGRAAFCMAPTNIPKEQRKTVDYSEYPLTPQGEMMQTLIRSRISTHPNPTVAMQFFETASRYADFFKVRKENVLPALEAFLDRRGIHHPSSVVRKRVFYLFYRFVQSLRIDIDIQHVPPILQAIQDLLTFDIELPADFELSDFSNVGDQEILANILKEPTIFDAQLYMFEAAGALISTLWSLPEHQPNALRSVAGPLLSRLSTSLQAPTVAAGGRMGEEDLKNVLAVHHCIQALGSIPKGFPEYPSPVPPDYIPPPLAEFRQMADAILVSLDFMGRFRIVREAARFAFGRIIFAAGPSITEYIPRLMSSLVVHFEASEFVEFIGFISHMTHKLQAQFTGVLEDVFSPLTAHVSDVISKPVTGTDDKVALLDTKKAFLSFLNTIMSSNLGSILVSQKNTANLQKFLETVLQMAADPSDTLNQKLALAFISKFLSLFGHAAPTASGNGSAPATNGAIIVPGIEQFIYQRILVVAFSIPFLPDFNLKDAQALATLQEIANLLQTIVKVRGDEALTYISTVFLPSQNVPAATAMELANNIRSLDKRSFQKYLTDFVKASRTS